MHYPDWIRWTENRLEVLTGRLSRGKGMQVLVIDGVSALVDHRASDLGSLSTCSPSGFYGEAIRKMALPTSPTVLDLGANIGGFPILLKRLGFKPAKGVCVELNPLTYARLTLNLHESLPSFEALNRGITADGRELSLALGAGSTGDSIYRSSGDRQVTIPGITLDDVSIRLEGEIDICKIDIEHAEAEVLRLGVESISALSRIRNVLIEIHPAEALHSVVECLQSYGLHWRANERRGSGPELGVNWFARST
jgi:FkbM family methyltransferase